MKLKKAIIGIALAAVFLLSGCSQKEKKADPVLNKTQVVQKMKKGFKSGQVNFSRSALYQVSRPLI